jgi:hypothetical protein
LQKVEGKIDAVLSYVDLSNIEIPDEFAAGQKHAKTSQPCHGTAFFAGTPVDGLGAPKVLIMGMQFLADQFRKQKPSIPKQLILQTISSCMHLKDRNRFYWKQVLKDFRSADWFSTEYS